jgi:hypothetical protein
VQAREVVALTAQRDEERARAEREAAAALERLRKELALEKRELAKQLEEERSANARLKQQAAAAEVGLTAAREAAAKAAQLLEDLERREEMAAGVRARSIADAKAALTGATSSRKPPASETPTVEVVSLEDIDMDLPE